MSNAGTFRTVRTVNTTAYEEYTIMKNGIVDDTFDEAIVRVDDGWQVIMNTSNNVGAADMYGFGILDTFEDALRIVEGRHFPASWRRKKSDVPANINIQNIRESRIQG